MLNTFYARVLRDLAESGAPRHVRLLRAFYEALEVLILKKRDSFGRALPLGDYLVDRWDKARALGFGEGTSVYDSCLIIGDVRVGKDCWIGPFTVLDGSGGLVIGDKVAISAGAHVYTHNAIGHWQKGTPMERAPVRIGNGVVLSPHAIVTAGVTIGDGALVGAHSLVVADVPAGMRVGGCPARPLGNA